MKISVLINAYNYGRFLKNAIDSVLYQSRPASEIIVVDDGSTDETDTVIRAIYEGRKPVRWIRQSNGGQLSAFQTGVLAATGDICFFLDADDCYHRDHLKLVMEYYEMYPRADFVFTNTDQCGVDIVKPVSSGRHDYGISVIRSYFTQPFIGNVTSTLSCRMHILRRLFPFPSEVLEEWRIRADDCLVFGASLVGANKHHYGVKTVNYGVHGSNGFFGREKSHVDDYLHTTRVFRFHHYLAAKYHLGDRLRQHAESEFLTIPEPSQEDIDVYDSIKKMAEEKKGVVSKFKRSCRKRVMAIRGFLPSNGVASVSPQVHIAECERSGLLGQQKCSNEELLAVLDPDFRAPLLSMYRGEPQLGTDTRTHSVDSATRISPSQGMWLYNFCLSVKPKAIIEIGMAYGYSTIYFLASIAKNQFGHHTAIDPFQRSQWHGIGLAHAQALTSRKGLNSAFQLIEERSDRAVIDLVRSKSTFDVIFIDGNHRFDDVLVDFYLYAPLCSIGGHIVFDDMWMSSIQAVASFVRANRVDFIEISTGESNICVFKKLGDDTRDWTDFHEFSVAYSKGNGTAKKSLGRGEKRWASKFVKSCGKRIRDVKGLLFGCEVSPNENAYCQSQTMQTHPLIEALECLRKAEEKESSILSRAVLPMNSIPEGSILLDVGANVGHLAEKLRTLFPQAQVRAIEADPATFEQLGVNTEADSSIRIYNRAIHSHRTMLTFYSHENSLLSSLKDLDQSQTKSITMEACSLDEFVADQKIENIVLLKIDTEGNDLNVLCGASEILRSESLRYVIVEFGISDAVQRHCHINDLVRKLTSFGFRAKCFGDWGVDGPAIYGNCLFERSSDLSRANE